MKFGYSNSILKNPVATCQQKYAINGLRISDKLISLSVDRINWDMSAMVANRK